MCGNVSVITEDGFILFGVICTLYVMISLNCFCLFSSE